MRKIESGSVRMSKSLKPLGAVAPHFKPSVPLFSGGCTVLSIQPSTSILSEKALAQLKYAFLQNKKVGIGGVRVDSLKPPSSSDLDKAQAAYSIAQELVEWSEKFIVDDQLSRLQDDHACLETKDDHKMNDKDSGYALDSKDDNEYLLRTKMFGELKDPEIKDPEIKDPEVKLELFDELKEIECSKFPCFVKSLDIMPVKAEAASYFDFAGNPVSRPASPTAFTPFTASKAEETLDFLKDTGCDGFDFFKSDMDLGGLLSYTAEPLESLDLTQHTLDIDLAFPVPPLPVHSKMDSDTPDLSSPIASPPASPFLFSPFSVSPHSPRSSDS